jgi:hypothetical protein
MQHSLTNKIAQVQIGQIFQSPFGKGNMGFASFVSIILSNAVAFAGIILFILMIVGGIMVMAGAGSGNKEEVAKGKKALTSAIIGFLVVFLSYWIIVIIENIFGFSILNPS